MKAITLTTTIAAVLIAFATSVNAGVTIQNAPASGSGMVPTGKGWGVQPTQALSPLISGNGIDYHGGPVMLGTTHIYYIWYGNWTGDTATTILTDFANNIGGSPYFNINTTYYDGNSNYVANQVSFANSTTDNYSQGTALNDAQIQTVVSSAIGRGALPADSNGVYFVLTSADVNETSGFCTTYCGWHTHGTISGLDIKYSFVGNSARCPSACVSGQTNSPNGNVGADGMANIIAHELEESVTDPDLNAWFDSTLAGENADKCVWTFGTVYQVANGAHANMKLGARDYLIQQNWLNANAGSCALLGIPSSITVPTTSATGSYTISWGATPGAVTRYELQEATDSAFTAPTLAYSGLSQSVGITGKANGTYYYRVRACYSGSCSDYRYGTNSVVVSIFIPPTGKCAAGYNDASGTTFIGDTNCGGTYQTINPSQACVPNMCSLDYYNSYFVSDGGIGTGTTYTITCPQGYSYSCRRHIVTD